MKQRCMHAIARDSMSISRIIRLVASRFPRRFRNASETLPRRIPHAAQDRAIEILISMLTPLNLSGKIHYDCLETRFRVKPSCLSRAQYSRDTPKRDAPRLPLRPTPNKKRRKILNYLSGEVFQAKFR